MERREKTIHYFDISMGQWPVAACGDYVTDVEPNFSLYWSPVTCQGCRQHIQMTLDRVRPVLRSNP